MKDYDIYKYFRKDNIVDQIPFIPIPQFPSDKYDEYIEGVSRLDILSNKYYGSPYFGKIILMGNPEYLNEWDIPNGAIIRIPFPIGTVINYIDNKFKEISLE